MDLHEPRTLDTVNRYVLHERPLEAEDRAVRPGHFARAMSYWS
jgi:hypothetical protein